MANNPVNTSSPLFNSPRRSNPPRRSSSPRRALPHTSPEQRARKLADNKPDKRLTVPYLHGVADQLLKDSELTIDQQHQLHTVVRYLELDPDTSSTHGRAALRCAELLIDNVRLGVYQRRYGVDRD